ncbi:MAG: ribonuclease P protein component [Vitreoscilla sp.]|nr:ribonuclease P protein component [Vitreoscilla sp.]
MIGRIVRPADFERVLATSPRSRSAHFAVHHVAGMPSRARAALATVPAESVVPALSPELSTGLHQHGAHPVDESKPAAIPGHWLGLVVPKRHAKRAVTRNLIKRQIRAAMASHAAALPGGLWVVRLKQPFDRKQFVSPASDQLQQAAHAEVATLFARAVVASAIPGRPA